MKDNKKTFSLSEDVSKDLLAVAKLQAADAVDENVERQDRVVAAGLFLETIAALEAGAVQFEEKVDLPSDLVRDALAELSADALEEAAEEIAGIIEEAIDDPHERENLEILGSQLDWSILYRQRFHSRLEGARSYLGEKTELTEEQQRAVEYFDALVKPLAWGLVFHNFTREGHALMVAPENRKKYWWWFEAIDLRWESLAAANELAEIIERYPSFERYFNRLRHASRVRLGLTKAELVPPKPVTNQDDEEVPAQGLMLAASSPTAKVLKKLTERSAIILTSDKGYRLWLNVDKPDFLKGIPQIKLPDGRLLDAEEAGRSKVWRFDGERPEKVVLIAELNGIHIEEEVSLE